MKTVSRNILGFILIVQCCSSPTQVISNTTDVRNTTSDIENTKNGSIKDQRINNIPQNRDDSQDAIYNKQYGKTNISERANTTDINPVDNKEVTIIDLEKVNKMSAIEFVGRQVRYLWDYLVHGKKEENESSFIGRCFGIAKKIRQLIPLVMIGGGVIITKLAFLVLFSLKTIGLLGLLLLLNVGTVAAKLGAFVSSKKSEHPQTIHYHVQPWKSDEHSYSSSHYGGSPYGWEDKSETGLENHELYNLYEKLRQEEDIKRYMSSIRGK